MTGKHLGKREVVAQVFVAACSGSATLSEEIGLPIVHVDVALDPKAAMKRLNAREHGSGVRADRMFQPILFDGGWSSWSLFHYEADSWPIRSGRPEGVRAIEGSILVSLPPPTPLSEFREQLHAALRHLRLQEVTSTMAYLEARSALLADYVVHPRYTPNPVDRGFRGASICNDLYVLDPAEDPWSLFWTVVAARLAAIEGRRCS